MAVLEPVARFDLVDWLDRRISERRPVDIAGVLVFIALIANLTVTGVLGNIYEETWMAWPGRQWTFVFRDYPWLYAVGLVVILALAWVVTGPEAKQKTTGVYALVVGGVGFLSGHVFW